MKNTFTTLLFIFGMGMAVLLQGCGAVGSSEDAITVSGEVRNQVTGNAITDAIVEITSPQAVRATTQSDSLGLFSFTVEVDSAFDITVQVNKQGFNGRTTSFRIAPGTDVTDLIIELSPEAGSGGGSEPSGGVGGESGGAAAIILRNITEEVINIAETGGIVNSAFTFEVQDSAGRSIDLNKAVDVNFSIISGPGGGESLTPATVRTNASGKATSNLFAGNTAGVVKIQAEIQRPAVSLTIVSKPIVITIHGGYPDLTHFSIAPDNYNFEGWDWNGITNAITVIVGDKFGNPVKPDTPVYFTTTGGIIQGSGTTNSDGMVTVNLISGEPRPTDAITGSGGRDGYSTITATTVDENDVEISKSINILFSTSTPIITANPTTFDLAPNGGASFDYTVTDQHGNPMAAGTTITISAGGDIEVTGDTDFTLGNFLFPGPGTTQFTFSIRDTDEDSADPASLSIKITVDPPVGPAVSVTPIQGTRRKAPPQSDVDVAY